MTHAHPGVPHGHMDTGRCIFALLAALCALPWGTGIGGVEYGGYGVEAKWTNMAAHRCSYMKLDGRSSLSISGLLSADGPVGETTEIDRSR